MQKVIAFTAALSSTLGTVSAIHIDMLPPQFILDFLADEQAADELDDQAAHKAAWAKAHEEAKATKEAELNAYEESRISNNLE